MGPARPPDATLPAPAANRSSDHDEVSTRAAWERILARIERRVRVVEHAVVELLDRDLEPPTRQRAIEEADLLAAWLGQLGVTAAADLTRQLRMVLDEDDLDVSHAMTAAALLEDLRTVLAGVIGELEAVPAARRHLLILGPLDARTDSVVWVALMSGCSVEVHAAGLPRSCDPDVVLVNAADSDAAAALPVLRAVREEFPGVPLVVVHPAADRPLPERLGMAALATTVVPVDVGPRDVVDELLDAERRAANEATAVAVGVGRDVVAHLDGRRLHIWSADLDAAIEQLADGRARALVLGTGLPGGVTAGDVTRLVRSDPVLRNAVVAHAAPGPDAEAWARAAAAGADLVVDVDAPSSHSVSSLVGALERRTRLEPLELEQRRSESLPWASARILVERRLVMAVRRDEVVSVIVMACDDEAGVQELSAHQDALAREFRREDVVARWKPDRQVVVLQGVGRRTASRRIAGVLKGVGDLADLCRVGVAEFPYDGRSLDDLLQAGNGVIERARALGGPAIVATDWRPEGETAADVLLVDPDHTLAGVLSSILGRAGVHTDHLHDGMEALHSLTGPAGRELPKLLVCEFDIPGVDGLQLLRRLRDVGLLGRFRVVMLAAGLRESQLRRALELGVVDIIRKPFSPTMFVHRVQRILEA